MNNIEKNLHEYYSTFYYPKNIEELLLYMNSKYQNIVDSGLKSGLQLDSESEKQLLHRLIIEGISYFIADKLKKKMLSYEESISEQPMLLAHPSGVTNQDYLNFVNSSKLKELIEEGYCVNEKMFTHM